MVELPRVGGPPVKLDSPCDAPPCLPVCKHIQKCGFPSSRGTHEGQHHARADVAVDVLQQHQVFLLGPDSVSHLGEGEHAVPAIALIQWGLREVRAFPLRVDVVVAGLFDGPVRHKALRDICQQLEQCNKHKQDSQPDPLVGFLSFEFQPMFQEKVAAAFLWEGAELFYGTIVEERAASRGHKLFLAALDFCPCQFVDGKALVRVAERRDPANPRQEHGRAVQRAGVSRKHQHGRQEGCADARCSIKIGRQRGGHASEGVRGHAEQPDGHQEINERHRVGAQAGAPVHDGAIKQTLGDGHRQVVDDCGQHDWECGVVLVLALEIKNLTDRQNRGNIGKRAHADECKHVEKQASLVVGILNGVAELKKGAADDCAHDKGLQDASANRGEIISHQLEAAQGEQEDLAPAGQGELLHAPHVGEVEPSVRQRLLLLHELDHVAVVRRHLKSLGKVVNNAL
mmetsp:Transcript_38710/g.97494  ORF Transcript_38710/g.97494 Transcript_38710/m.97494 type:complete len:456 (-) Transcript_38710:1397-2764(-)